MHMKRQKQFYKTTSSLTRLTKWSHIANSASRAPWQQLRTGWRRHINQHQTKQYTKLAVENFIKPPTRQNHSGNKKCVPNFSRDGLAQSKIKPTRLIRTMKSLLTTVDDTTAVSNTEEDEALTQHISK